MYNLNKRGQLTQTVLISIIIVVLTGAIILLFFKGFDFGTQIDREACRASVALRDNAILRGDVAFIHETIPLKCKTEYIEIKTDNQELMKKDITDAMYNCWWMMGEGKLQPFSESTWRSFQIPGKGNAESSCVICSTIKFNENLQKKNLQLDLADYMSNTKIPLKNITYLQYFSGDANAKLSTGIDVPKISTSQEYTVLFMGIRGKNFWDVLIADATAVGLTSGMVFSMPGGSGALSAVGRLIASHPIIATVVVGGVIATQGVATAYSNNYVATKCDGNWEGCFQVILAPKNIETINNVCQNIESIP